MLRWAGVVALVVNAHVAAGQATDTLWREYQVRGVYEETEMQPWRATLRVADSTLGGTKATQARYRSRFSGGRWMFDYVAVWSSSGEMRARLVGEGRAGKALCELSFASGTIEGLTDQGPLTPKPAQGVVIPDFALGGYLSTMKLKAGDTVRVSVVKCLPQFGSAGISVTPFVGVVSADEQVATPGSIPVPTWEIKGIGEYPAEVIVRQRDGAVLRARTPQGANAYSVESLAGDK